METKRRSAGKFEAEARMEVNLDGPSLTLRIENLSGEILEQLIEFLRRGWPVPVDEDFPSYPPWDSAQAMADGWGEWFENFPVCITLSWPQGWPEQVVKAQQEIDEIWEGYTSDWDENEERDSSVRQREENAVYRRLQKRCGGMGPAFYLDLDDYD